MSEKNASYNSFPNLSPYLSRDRYQDPKEDHKFILNEIKKRCVDGRNYSLCDLGCAHGDLLYLIKRNFPEWKLTGYDYTKEFIDYAKAFEGLEGVRLICEDLFKINDKFDFVISDGVTQIFPDIEKTINQYLDICNSGGYVITTGRFNKYDIEVRMQYCDNSNDEARGVWRQDWSFHSRKSIRNKFENKVKKLDFLDVTMDKDLPYNQNMPINQWTFRDSNGKNIITNGTNFILNKTLLMIEK